MDPFFDASAGPSRMLYLYQRCCGRFCVWRREPLLDHGLQGNNIRSVDSMIDWLLNGRDRAELYMPVGDL